MSLERVGLGRARTGDAVEAQAIGVRAALEQSGLDHGPISVHDKMRSMGVVPVPSTAALSRIFRDAGVARVEPRKKPRASFRRFVYPAPNACWQLDGIEYVLTGGRKRVIFQIIDDHARLAIATHVAWGETSEGAIVVVKKGIAAHGVPQRLLTDNGAVLNPSRRGAVGQLVTYVNRLGIEPITGKPDKPTTQGKNERFRRTLFRCLDKQPLAASLEELQVQVDEFDRIYKLSDPTRDCPAGSPRSRPGMRHRKLTRRGHETNSDRLAGMGSAAPRSPSTESSRCAKPGSTSPVSSPASASISWRPTTTSSSSTTRAPSS